MESPGSSDHEPDCITVGLGLTEGPVWTTGGSILVTSLDQGKIFQVSLDGQSSIFCDIGGSPNGLTEGTDGRLYVAQCSDAWRLSSPGLHDAGRPAGEGAGPGIHVIDGSGQVTEVSSEIRAPNDLCFGPDGYLYVTDPTRGSTIDGRLWRCDVETGRVQLLSHVAWYPNGIAFGPDDGLYVASTHESRIVRYELRDGDLTGGDTAIEMPFGKPDGFAFDTDGNILIAAIGADGQLGGVQVWDTNLRLVEVILYPRTLCTNLAVSGEGALVVTGDGEVRVHSSWSARGLELYPHRADLDGDQR